MSQSNQPVDWKLLYKDVIRVFKKDKEIKPKTLGQQKYIEAVRKNDIVFAIGPAGTGKTYLAVAIALSALKNEEVDRIILVRPAVEAGESLGYLPGDLLEKIDPYFRRCNVRDDAFRKIPKVYGKRDNRNSPFSLYEGKNLK